MNDAVRAERMTEKEALGGVLEESEAEMLDSEDDGGGGDDGRGSSDDDEEVRFRRGGAVNGRDKKKKKNKYDEDDDYNEKDGLFNDDSSEEEEDDGEDYESDEGLTNSRPLRRSTRNNTKSYVDVDEQDIGTADEDSGDEDTGPSILVSPAKNNRSGIMSYGSPKLRGKARASKKPLSLEEDSGEEDNTSDRSDDDDSNHNLTYFQHKCTQKQSPTKLKTTTICCPSKIDEITMMPLPAGKPHICFVSPDGNTRHCFTLETFYRIAISAKTSDGQNTLASDDSRLQFLQPPHFRTPISDDLLDQIASRFGRGALIIENSTLYKKMKQRSTGGFRGDVDVEDEMEEMFDSDGEYVGPGGRGGSGGGQNFDERFRRYVQNLMGSQDVYCCPLCYNEAYRRLGNMGHDEMIEDDASDEDDEDDGDVNDKKEDRFSFLDDPMTILGHLDHQEFEIASTFCFRLLIGVKNHLRSVHLVDLSVLEGNDLFKRFQIRAGDGLLQSWLRKSLKKSMVQGDMMRYWNEGENQAFLLLLNQMDKGELKGDQSGSSGSDFSLSFPNRARKVWAELCSPFLKVQDDIEDFLADEDEDAESCAVPINPHFTPPTNQTEQVKSPEEKMLEYLQKKNARHAASSSENESESEESSVELEVLSKEGSDDEEEEEEEVEDEWTRSKQYKQEARKRSSRNKDESDNDSAMFDVPKTPINDDFRKEIGNDDSDDDDEKPITRVNGNARKHIADSSDEES
ncbi:hypothetical protein HJC23_004140 [Cyclotella cryptica]|uniref:Uncharacterized protein n=1 Tax=Cyclotella cryptica TaxID=29204 RepID=A0ABD3PIX9_9STRA|eukprot:CCRYP_014680-RA/>CCRYP_014680-RA protein AED:0.01 eAED:0.01 QI:784/1/1/1/1/1/2/228/739